MRDRVETPSKNGMKKGENNMKKLMILAAAAAMAFGAQAGALQFNLTCQNVPVSVTKITGDSYFCLIDPEKSQILAYVQPKEFGGQKTKFDDYGSPNDYVTSFGESKTHNGETITINGTDYTVNEHVVAGSSTKVIDKFNGTWDYGTQTGSATEKDVVFQMFVNSSNSDTEAILGLYDTQSVDTSLLAVIWDPSGYYQEYKVGVTGNSDPILFSAKGPYNPVPEPTSGLLLLLGMAGLALKRKQVA